MASGAGRRFGEYGEVVFRCRMEIDHFDAGRCAGDYPFRRVHRVVGEGVEDSGGDCVLDEDVRMRWRSPGEIDRGGRSIG